MSIDGLSSDLRAAVMRDGAIDYVKLAGIAKSNDKLAEEAGKLLQKMLSGQEANIFGNKIVTIEQTNNNNNVIRTTISDENSDNMPDSIESCEMDADNNTVNSVEERDMDGVPDSYNEYYSNGKLHYSRWVIHNDDGTKEIGVSEYDENGNISKSYTEPFPSVGI